MTRASAPLRIESTKGVPAMVDIITNAYNEAAPQAQRVVQGMSGYV